MNCIELDFANEPGLGIAFQVELKINRHENFSVNCGIPIFHHDFSHGSLVVSLRSHHQPVVRGETNTRREDYRGIFGHRFYLNVPFKRITKMAP